jgi:transmembrane sensor
MFHSERFIELMDKYLSGKASLPERNELFNMMSSDDTQHNEWLDQHVSATLQTGKIEGPSLTGEQKQAILKNVFASKQESAPVIELKDRKRSTTRWMVAAAIVLAAATGTYTLFQPSQNTTPSVAQAQSQRPEDLTAGSNKATLTLADGSQISLDQKPNGLLAKQGKINVIKTDGRLAYSSNEQESGSAEVMYNTITVPAGSQYMVTLPDGSNVWLNTYSSLRFPVAFAGDERRVELTGEAYFEVAKNPGKKFFVSAEGVNTEVLGTHFNVSAYSNEDVKRVTLAEGSVRVSGKGAGGLLKPGQQAQLKNAKVKIVDIEADQVIVWKNGYFTAGRIEYLMNQIGRWYDKEIVYEGAIPEKDFGGKIARESLSDVLATLKVNRINVRLAANGNQIIVSN